MRQFDIRYQVRESTDGVWDREPNQVGVVVVSARNSVDALDLFEARLRARIGARPRGAGLGRP